MISRLFVQILALNTRKTKNEQKMPGLVYIKRCLFKNEKSIGQSYKHFTLVN